MPGCGKHGKALQIVVIYAPDRWRMAEYPALIPGKRAPSVLYYRALVPPDGSCIPTLRRHAFSPAHREEGRQRAVSLPDRKRHDCLLHAINGPPVKGTLRVQPESTGQPVPELHH